VESYRSSILDMFDTRDAIRESFVHKTFLQANMYQAIHNDQVRPVDIEPILSHTR
jgi:hypothetical protein